MNVRRTLAMAVRTTAITAAIALIGVDVASACHKRRAAGCVTRTSMVYGCAPAAMGHGGFYGAPVGMTGGAVYASAPMASHQGAAFGVGVNPSAMPAMTGYGVTGPVMGRGMVGQAIAVPGRVMGGIGRGIGGGFGGMGYGVPGAFGGPVGGVPGPGMGGFGAGMPGATGVGGWGY